MSAAGRGKRLGGEHDDYPTPAWCVDRLMEVWRPRLDRPIWEPTAGSGQIIRAMQQNIHADDVLRLFWIACEIQDKYWHQLQKVPRTHVPRPDFFKVEYTGSEAANWIGSVVSNPPYHLAEQVIRHSRKLCPDAEIVMLLRQGFFGSDAREAFFEELGVPDTLLLPNRPKFVLESSRSDNCEYAWMIWPSEPRKQGVIQRLATTSLEERKRRHTV